MNVCYVTMETALKRGQKHKICPFYDAFFLLDFDLMKHTKTKEQIWIIGKIEFLWAANKSYDDDNTDTAPTPAINEFCCCSSNIMQISLFHLHFRFQLRKMWLKENCHCFPIDLDQNIFKLFLPHPWVMTEQRNRPKLIQLNCLEP